MGQREQQQNDRRSALWTGAGAWMQGRRGAQTLVAFMDGRPLASDRSDTTTDKRRQTEDRTAQAQPAQRDHHAHPSCLTAAHTSLIDASPCSVSAQSSTHPLDTPHSQPRIVRRSVDQQQQQGQSQPDSRTARSSRLSATALIMAGVSKKSAYPNLVNDAEKCARFLSEFVEDYATGDKKYVDQLQRIANREQNTLNISIDDIKQVRRRKRRSNQREGRKRRQQCKGR